MAQPTKAKSNVVMIPPSYRVGRKLGAGNFGEIRIGRNIHNNDGIAIKLEIMNASSPQLESEYEKYKRLGKAEGVPKIYHFGNCLKYHALVMELLGPSLDELFERCSRNFSVKTVTMIALQLLHRLKFVHSKCIIFRDVKPDNFLIGQRARRNRNTIHIVDFGLAKEYCNEYGAHILMKERSSLTGTARYMSINSHLGKEQSRRDDLESLGYMLVYFLKGKLPWQGLPSTEMFERFNKILAVKQQTSIDSLCSLIPEEFATYLQYCRRLKFSEEPDYLYLINLFKGLMKHHNWECNWDFDWLRVDFWNGEVRDSDLNASDLFERVDHGNNINSSRHKTNSNKTTRNLLPQNLNSTVKNKPSPDQLEAMVNSADENDQMTSTGIKRLVDRCLSCWCWKKKTKVVPVSR